MTETWGYCAIAGTSRFDLLKWFEGDPRIDLENPAVMARLRKCNEEARRYPGTHLNGTDPCKNCPLRIGYDLENLWK